MKSDKKLMRILLSAYACEPHKGSEPGVGWNVAKELSSRVDLTVLTRSNNQVPIENSGEAWVNDVNWIYWDPPIWLTFWKKGGRGVQLFYMIWQAGVASAVRKRVKLNKYDVIHHITFGKYWIPSSLAKLGIPFIFGPVGGGETTPPSLIKSRSWRARISEFCKSVFVKTITSQPGIRRLYQNASWTFAATQQTMSALEKLGVKSISLLPQSGIHRDDFVAQIQAIKRTEEKNPITLITASRLIHWKAIDLAIEATALAAESIDVHLMILQDGPEKMRLQHLVNRLGIEDRVTFKGKLTSLEQVHRQIRDADALIHPALHEAFGQACLESLALGTPVICLDWAGPGLIINEVTGIAIRPLSKDETILSLSQAIQKIASEIKDGISRSDACRSRAIQNFEWSQIVNEVMLKYESVTK
jgi:glycosyltransferase involved in cell wall biosynthesis